MTANRSQRRAAASSAKKVARKSRSSRAAAEAICLVRGHVHEDAWVMRPAYVGAGIVIPKVHFDRTCQRCGKLDVVWADILGETRALESTMTLGEWLISHGARVNAPEGTIRVPDAQELSAIIRRAGS